MTSITFRPSSMQECPTLDDLVADISHLVSPPEIHWQLEEAIESPYSSWERVADIISQDPNLSAQLLKLANSAFHAQRHVDTLSRAVALLGTRVLYDLAIGVSAMGVFQRLPAELLDVSAFWRHSLATGMVAKTLAQHANVLHPERLFVAGLLHEVGILALCMRFPHRMSEALTPARHDEDLLAPRERELFGYDHAEVGARLLELWHLPISTTDSVRHHHRPWLAKGPSLEPALVHLADKIANARAETSLTGVLAADAEAAPADPAIWAMAGLEAGCVEALSPTLETEFERAAELMGLER